MYQFDSKESQSTLDYLNAALDRGSIYAVFPFDNECLSKDDIRCFGNRWDALEYCYENSTDHDKLIFKPINILKIQLHELVNESIGKDSNTIYTDRTSTQIDYDANPLFNKDGNAFTDALSEHWENEHIKSLKKLTTMDEKSLAFNEGQFKRVGLSEAFTPDLVARVENGEPLIKHGFKKEYEGDKVDATIYLKKSPTSDYYFLNKFDLELQKEGQTNSVKQTFHVSQKSKLAKEDEPVKKEYFTLKEAYNLLAGRPVFKDMVNKEGTEYEAWNKINFSNVLQNGNHEVKQYNNNYGFQLDSVLRNYPIKEMANEAYKKSLIDSLERGNLQKVTFVGKDGSTEKLYVSPSITTSSLNVYSLDKKRIGLDVLLEKQYVSKELGERLKQQFSEKVKPSPKLSETDTNNKKKKEAKEEVKKNYEPRTKIK